MFGRKRERAHEVEPTCLSRSSIYGNKRERRQGERKKDRERERERERQTDREGGRG